jgi:hypothetical protein
MPHVFISYSKRDRAYATRLAKFLQENGFDVWMDNQIEPSDDWWKSIVTALKTCGAFIVIMTPEADASDWVQREVTIADQLKKPMFPLLLEGNANLLESQNWSIFVRTQYEDVRGGKLPPQDFLTKLAGKVKRKTGYGENLAVELPPSSRPSSPVNPVKPAQPVPHPPSSPEKKPMTLSQLGETIVEGIELVFGLSFLGLVGALGVSLLWGIALIISTTLFDYDLGSHIPLEIFIATNVIGAIALIVGVLKDE